jgi:hypothetical protein
MQCSYCAAADVLHVGRLHERYLKKALPSSSSDISIASHRLLVFVSVSSAWKYKYKPAPPCKYK